MRQTNMGSEEVMFRDSDTFLLLRSCEASEHLKQQIVQNNKYDSD